MRLGQTCKTQTNFIGDCNPVMFDLHIIKLQTERERGGEREREGELCGRRICGFLNVILKLFSFFLGGRGCIKVTLT